MKALLVSLLMLGMASMAYAQDRVASGSGGFLSDEEDDAPVVIPASVSIPRPAVRPIVQAPLAPPKPISVMPTTPNAPAPFQATLGEGDCPKVIPHPQARNTPLRVLVDQQTQKIHIISPDYPEPQESVVSTGGGLKVPNGKYKKPPYCARTPRRDRVIVSAVKEEMFKDTKCTDEQKRARSTVFPMYRSSTFTDRKGNPAPMASAIRIFDGIFFHSAGSYTKLLGQNVSGECVRLKPSMAAKLQQQLEKYGAMEVNITETPVAIPGTAGYCDQNILARAMDDWNRGNLTASQTTGSEDVYGGTESALALKARVMNASTSAGGQLPPPRPKQLTGG